MNGSIYIGFSKSDKWLSRAICWLTRSDVSHAAVIYTDETWGGWWVAEADIRGVHSRPLLSKRDWKYVFKVQYDLSLDMMKARKHFDEHYDFVGFTVLGVILILGRMIKHRLKFPFRTTEGQICSEFVSRILHKPMGDDNPQWVTPKELKGMCKRRSDLFLEIDPSIFKN
jgi:hypothetical protein